MAAAFYNIFTPYRNLCMKNIIEAFTEKKWLIAKELSREYADYCKKYWEEYTDEFLNFPITKCGGCSEQKQFLVDCKWPEARRNHFSGQLVCMNCACDYYLIINFDQYIVFSCKLNENGEN